jgi:hypothetical protein
MSSAFDCGNRRGGAHDSVGLAQGHRHNQSCCIGVSNCHQDLCNSESFCPRPRPAKQSDCWLPTTRDFDLSPSKGPPARSQRLHHGLFSRKSRSQPGRRRRETKSVLSLVISETSFGEARILLEHSLNSSDIGKVDSESQYAHTFTLMEVRPVLGGV